MPQNAEAAEVHIIRLKISLGDELVGTAPPSRSADPETMRRRTGKTIAPTGMTFARGKIDRDVSTH
jgi:hypothetical protein